MVGGAATRMMHLRSLEPLSANRKTGPKPSEPMVYPPVEPFTVIASRGRAALASHRCGRCGSAMLMSERDLEAGPTVVCLICSARHYPT